MQAYFDCAATTPLAAEVLEVMKPYFSEKYGNPSSLHSWGQEAQAAVDKARKFLADYFGVEFTGVIFTASATEANNLAIQGVVNRKISQDAEKREETNSFSLSVPHLIVSRIEHSSVLEPCRFLEAQGRAEITYLEVDRDGFVDLNQLKNSLRKETVLVSVMQVNNETGAIQPIKEIGKIIREFKQEKLKPKNQSKYSVVDLQYPFFHTDAVQGLGHLREIKLAELGVDLMTVSGHKIYGPKGVGALLINSSLTTGKIQPLIFGGGQEFGFRAGTENVPAIVGFAKAVELAEGFLVDQSHQLKKIKQKLVEGIKKAFPKAVINSPSNSISEILNLSFPGFKNEELIYRFDQFGIAVSGGAACGARALKPSHVLKAMGLPESVVLSAIRFSFGRKTTPVEIEYLLAKLPEILNF